MGVVGLMFEPHPPNFEKLYNFLRCSNDIKTFFLISLLVSDIKKMEKSSSSIYRDVHGLAEKRLAILFHKNNPTQDFIRRNFRLL